MALRQPKKAQPQPPTTGRPMCRSLGGRNVRRLSFVLSDPAQPNRGQGILPREEWARRKSGNGDSVCIGESNANIGGGRAGSGVPVWRKPRKGVEQNKDGEYRTFERRITPVPLTDSSGTKRGT